MRRHDDTRPRGHLSVIQPIGQKDMAPVLLQIDFPFQGPWGDEMAAAFEGLAKEIAGTKGLRWKIWTENKEEGRSGGIYLFDDAASAAAYKEMHTKRLAGFGVQDIRALEFGVGAALSAITRAPVS
eukprot:tig00000093_g3595.t1